MLTDIAIKRAIREAQAQGKAIKRFDERGLFLLAKPNGAGLWRLRYSFEGREKLISLGIYDEVTLKRARSKRDDARRQLDHGVDPSAARRAVKLAQANSVELVANEWLSKQANIDSGTVRRHRARLERYVYPLIGRRPMANVEPEDLMDVLRRIEKSPRRNYSNLETAKRVRQLCGQVWRYGIATRRAKRDIAADLKGALTPPTPKNLAAILKPERVGELLRSIYGYAGSPATMAALKLSALLFGRPGEIRKMEWAEIDFAEAIWKIPKEKMKMRTEHWVPLSTQAIQILRDLEPITGGGKYVFPGLRTPQRPMSENTANGALRRLGYTGDEQTAHGFRTIASTLLNEMMEKNSRLWSPDAIEAQLAHQQGDAVRRSYNKAQYLPERVRLMQHWADHCDTLRAGGNVVDIRRSA
jgi:integrase